MPTHPSFPDRLLAAVSRDRLLDAAVKLVAVPSRTGEAGAAADRLAELLSADGFAVERPAAGHPAAPAVVVRLESGRSGRTLQFDGHLDTVHLPFVPPAVTDGRLTGSGSCDMKGGVAAAVEALRALRAAGGPPAGAVLLTAHDLHEAPWGLGQQLDALIRAGVVGDGVLIPEPLSAHLPVVGRGAATWQVTLRRAGPPVHEVMRPADEPDVIAAGADLVRRLGELGERLSAESDPLAGRASVFVGQFHAGEIYNQSPQECWLEGTRRWLPGTARDAVEAGFRGLVEEAAADHGVTAETRFTFIRDAFKLDVTDPLVAAFQASHEAVSGRPLPTGPKPFVDDGNSFCGLAGVPAVTHGPRSGGQHTVREWVEIDDLVRLAKVYALTAARYCEEE
jgi:acetylornithine deacetylase/succinyl-diaminopimelate desuccinylase-like protein